jgi:hypothetical protein
MSSPKEEKRCTNKNTKSLIFVAMGTFVGILLGKLGVYFY